MIFCPSIGVVGVHSDMYDCVGAMYPPRVWDTFIYLSLYSEKGKKQVHIYWCYYFTRSSMRTSYFDLIIPSVLILSAEQPYDSIPNFSAADALRLTGIGRNEFIDIMNKCRSKVLIRVLSVQTCMYFLTFSLQIFIINSLSKFI